uniref:Uncharacterized protein n=1 Tax=Arundo donax TaxID=35708 RepID=A0A0A9HEX3_ARUDO
MGGRRKNRGARTLPCQMINLVFLFPPFVSMLCG